MFGTNAAELSQLLPGCWVDYLELTWQGLRHLDLANVMGCLPAECDSFLKTLTKLTSLRLHNESMASKMPPMHCLSELTSLQVRGGVVPF